MVSVVMKYRLLVLTWMLLIAFTLADADDLPLEFSSGTQHVPLVELYTSEGCSSCPPADRWLSKLKTNPGLWKQFTPIAFHVDYWDYIGWNDEFAKATFGERQRRYADQGASRFVYTPGLFRSGSEWNGWRSGRAPSGNEQDVGDLTLLVKGPSLQAQFDALQVYDEDMILHIATLAMDLETRVKAGENKGKTLRHDFVATNLASIPLIANGGRYQASGEFAHFVEHPSELAIVAWISSDTRQKPIQSVGGFLK
jgi:hypothetical protein